MAQTPAIPFDKDAIYTYVNQVAANNVHYVMDEIPKRSPILEDMLNQGQIANCGRHVRYGTGYRKFYEHRHWSILNWKSLLACQMRVFPFLKN